MLPLPRLLRRLALLVALVPFFAPQIVPFYSPDTVRFFAGMVTLIPLTVLLGSAVEQLWDYVGDTIGDLLGVATANVSTIVLPGALLFMAASGAYGTRQGDLVSLVLYYIAGCIIFSVLFLPGLAIFLGALRNGRMQFSAASAGGHARRFGIAVVILLLPSLAFKFALGVGAFAQASALLMTPQHLFVISDAVAVVLILTYLFYISSVIFRVGERARRRVPDTQALFSEEREAAEAFFDTQALFSEEREAAERRIREEEESAIGRQRRGVLRRTRFARFIFNLALIAVAVAAIVFVSVRVAASVPGGPLGGLHWNPLFVGLIVLPLPDFLGEAGGAIVSAWGNRLEVTLAISASSAVQVILLVVPVLVLASHLFGLGSLPLLFGFFLVATLGIAAYVFRMTLMDGEVSWLDGAQLLLLFLAVALVSWISGAIAQ